MGVRCFELRLPNGADTDEFERIMVERVLPAIGSYIQSPDGTMGVSSRSVANPSVDFSTPGTAVHRLFRAQPTGSLDPGRIIDSAAVRYIWLTFQVLAAPQPAPRARGQLSVVDTNCTELFNWFANGFPEGVPVRLKPAPACTKFSEVPDSAISTRFFGFSVPSDAGDFVGAMISIFTNVRVGTDFGLHRLFSDSTVPAATYVWLPFSVLDQKQNPLLRGVPIVQLASAATTCEELARSFADLGHPEVECTGLEEVIYQPSSPQISTAGVLSEGGRF
jgi:hypothetical protein